MSESMAWSLLVVSGILEVCWATGLKYSEGFTKLIPSVITLIILAIGMYLLAKATEVIPLGTAYAVWVGIGALGAAVVGIVLFQESASPMRILFLVMLLVSIAGLKLTSH